MNSKFCCINLLRKKVTWDLQELRPSKKQEILTKYLEHLRENDYLADDKIFAQGSRHRQFFITANCSDDGCDYYTCFIMAMTTFFTNIITFCGCDYCQLSLEFF